MGFAISLSKVIAAKCFVLIAKGISSGITAERPMVPMIVMITSPEYIRYLSNSLYFSRVMNRRSPQVK